MRASRLAALTAAVMAFELVVYLEASKAGVTVVW